MSSVRTSAVPVRINTFMTSKTNSFSTSMQRYAGRESFIIKGSCLLKNLHAPKLAAISFASSSVITVPIENIPMHPVLWSCNRVMNQFTSYIRWKLKSVKARFVPYVGANQPGQLLMGFTSCIQDGGPDGSDEVLQSSIMDMPGSIAVSLGFPSDKTTCSKMPFIDAFGWGFTCRSGSDVNEIYQGALIVALTGGPDLFRSSSGNVYLGQIILDYEIALAEPASTLSLIRPSVKGLYRGNIGPNGPVFLALDPDAVKPGDILALPWYPPSESGAENDALRFVDTSGGLAYKQPKIGETVYVRAGNYDNNIPGSTVSGMIYPSLAAAQRPVTSTYENALANTSASMMTTTNWVTAGIDLAKVILPTIIDTAATLLL